MYKYIYIYTHIYIYIARRLFRLLTKINMICVCVCVCVCVYCQTPVPPAHQDQHDRRAPAARYAGSRLVVRDRRQVSFALLYRFLLPYYTYIIVVRDRRQVSFPFFLISETGDRSLFIFFFNFRDWRQVSLFMYKGLLYRSLLNALLHIYYRGPRAATGLFSFIKACYIGLF